MKVRDSGMPGVSYWESLFNVPLILERFGIGNLTGDIVELGCGYGTFTIPVAQQIQGTLTTFDIEPDMVEYTQNRLVEKNIHNVIVQQRDVLKAGYGLPEESVSACLLFNILHHDNPVDLLRLSAHIVRKGGWVLVMHWVFDPKTPRGPSLTIRPKPEDIVRWAEETTLLAHTGKVLDLPPWHYGLGLQRI